MSAQVKTSSLPQLTEWRLGKAGSYLIFVVGKEDEHHVGEASEMKHTISPFNTWWAWYGLVTLAATERGHGHNIIDSRGCCLSVLESQYTLTIAQQVELKKWKKAQQSIKDSLVQKEPEDKPSLSEALDSFVAKMESLNDKVAKLTLRVKALEALHDDSRD